MKASAEAAATMFSAPLIQMIYFKFQISAFLEMECNRGILNSFGLGRKDVY